MSSTRILQKNHLLGKMLHLILVLAIAAGVLAASARPAAASAPASDQDVAEFEVRIMKQFVDHHMLADVMGTMCMYKAEHDELVEMCEQMIIDQTMEIHDFRSWLKDWYEVHYQPQMDKQGKMMIEELTGLQGKQFEIRFMEMMIEHHQMAIEMGEKCVQRAEHDELISTCQNIIEKQSAEKEQLKTWLCEWYGICKEDDSKE